MTTLNKCVAKILPEATPHLTVLSFNILSPGYKRTKHVASPSSLTSSGRSATEPTPALHVQRSNISPANPARENAHPNLWKTRHASIISTILDGVGVEDAVGGEGCVDMICLQEYEFSQEFRQLYEHIYSPSCQKDNCPLSEHHHLSSYYTFHLLQRTSDKPDGIAVLVRKREGKGMAFVVERRHEMKLGGYGDRVALALQVRVEISPTSSSLSSSSTPTPTSFSFLLMSTHLTFPHSFFDIQQRKYEISCLLSKIDSFRKEANVGE